MQFSSVFTQAMVALFVARAAAAPLAEGGSIDKRAKRLGKEGDGLQSRPRGPARSCQKKGGRGGGFECQVMGCEQSPSTVVRRPRSLESRQLPSSHELGAPIVSRGVVVKRAKKPAPKKPARKPSRGGVRCGLSGCDNTAPADIVKSLASTSDTRKPGYKIGLRDVVVKRAAKKPAPKDPKKKSAKKPASVCQAYGPPKKPAGGIVRRTHHVQRPSPAAGRSPGPATSKQSASEPSKPLDWRNNVIALRDVHREVAKE
ncbi:hypothetical protein MAPG_01326 [Magnaporthiopsis poae ATCC 64411]|uniref:Uncharacterized protein n=1 Tax=Magnaporthiopsis poae (strain ATCC 64411 / 73-15) TaxID=644358 RepID=A0A0C4DNE5_MAGP6|nr:hypothetical protein MAPG_01326 [Magnaporthiopsis poae ATCC 64411]